MRALSTLCSILDRAGAHHHGHSGLGKISLAARVRISSLGAALPRWGKGRCVGAGRRCLPAARALREGARPVLGFWDGGGGRNSSACKRACCRARGERRAGCFDVWPHAQGHGSGGATAGPARTRLRDLSLKNPIGCRARIATLQRKPGGSCA